MSSSHQISSSLAAALAANLKPTAVRASAGSGKTHSLALRYIALLLSGVRPNSVLATTFTRKAAGEILERVLMLLTAAVLAPEKLANLTEQLRLPPGAIGAQQLLTTLYGLVSQQHALRVSTFDSWANTLVRQFELELGLRPGWRTLEPAEEQQLYLGAVQQIIEQADPKLLVELLRLLKRGRTSRAIISDLVDKLQKLSAQYGESNQEQWGWLLQTEGVQSSEHFLSELELDGNTEQIFSRLAAGINQAPLPTSGSGKNIKEDARFRKAVDKLLEIFQAEGWADLAGNTLLLAAIKEGGRYFQKELTPQLKQALEPLFHLVRVRVAGQIHNQNLATWIMLRYFSEAVLARSRELGSHTFTGIKELIAHQAEELVGEELWYRLDGRVQHLLFDEFQDTSPNEWALIEPLVREVLSGTGERSFFLVGDVKQAIYGWRGGVAALFDAVLESWPQLQLEDRSLSFRSSSVVLDFVNQLFGSLESNQSLAEWGQALGEWQRGFSDHSAARVGLPGYVEVSLVDQQDGSAEFEEGEGEEESTSVEVPGFYRRLARQISEILAGNPALTVGILLRTNRDVVESVQWLRQLNIIASQEGGVPLSSSPAVAYLLALLTLIDHPADLVAAEQLKLFPAIQAALEGVLPLSEPISLRRTLQLEGLVGFVRLFIQGIGPLLSVTERRQLFEVGKLAESYQRRGALVRTVEFVSFVRGRKVELIEHSSVRVMTVHQSKGLEFDAVFLPQLGSKVIGGRAPVTIGSGSGVLSPQDRLSVCPDQSVRALLPELEELHRGYQERNLVEQLNLLYVALTRARQGLYLYIPDSQSGEGRTSVTFGDLIRAALGAETQPDDSGALFASGDREWFRAPKDSDKGGDSLLSVKNGRRREYLDLSAGSSRVRSRINPSANGRGRGAPGFLKEFGEVSANGNVRALKQRLGTFLHRVLATVTWYDENVIERGCSQVDYDLLSGLGLSPSDCLALLKGAELRKLLSLERYDQRIGSMIQVYNELSFNLLDGDRLISGQIDRLVLWGEVGKPPTGCEVIDFKSDFEATEDELTEQESVRRNNLHRNNLHWPQLDLYRQAAAQLTGLPVNQVAGVLMLLGRDRILLDR